jgi:hypothetical protein
VGADDDEDCVEHVWSLSELAVNPETMRFDRVQRCGRCGAASYAGAQATDPSRPRL